MPARCMQALGTSPADLDADAAELGEGAVQALTNTVKAWQGRCDPSKLVLLSQVLVSSARQRMQHGSSLGHELAHM